MKMKNRLNGENVYKPYKIYVHFLQFQLIFPILIFTDQHLITNTSCASC